MAWSSMVTMPEAYKWLWWIWLGFLGMCLGSFLNVVIWRLPRDMSIIRPGSSCPSCKTPIRWYDNIPLVSYILLLGRCRCCKARISLRYPLIEVASGALTVLVFVRFGVSAQTAIILLLVLAMVAVAIIDAEHMEIPDEISLGGAAVGLILSFVPNGVSPLDAVIGAVGGSAFLGLLRWSHMKIAKIEGMGLGDIKLAATLGAFLGWYSLPVIFFISAILGLSVGGLLLVAQRKGGRTPLPFGTFLAAGTIVYIFTEPWLIRLFLQITR